MPDKTGKGFALQTSQVIEVRFLVSVLCCQFVAHMLYALATLPVKKYISIYVLLLLLLLSLLLLLLLKLKLVYCLKTGFEKQHPELTFFV